MSLIPITIAAHVIKSMLQGPCTVLTCDMPIKCLWHHCKQQDREQDCNRIAISSPMLAIQNFTVLVVILNLL